MSLVCSSICLAEDGYATVYRLSVCSSVTLRYPRPLILAPIESAHCVFLFVRHSNLGPILHRFGDTAGFVCSWPNPYSTLILGVFPLHQIAHVGVNVRLAVTLSYSAVKLFLKYSKLCENHHTGCNTSKIYSS